MKRLHIHLRTKDLDKSIRFYSALFGSAPVKQEPDYAKWLLDDPAANVSLSTHDGASGVDHVGISLDTREELEAAAQRLRGIDALPVAEEATTCCYAKSNKYWINDPQDAVWELFQTYGQSDVYGADPEREMAAPQQKENTACCGPA